MNYVERNGILIPGHEARHRPVIRASAAMRVEGMYRVYLNGKPAGVARDHPNLVTDGGLDRLFNGSISFAYVGTGNSAPAVTDTVLQAPLASTSSNSPLGTVQSYGGTTPNEYVQCIFGKRFAQGSVVGNIAELGYGWSTGLYSRALILDGGGSPTTIAVTADDTLDIEYIARLYPTPADVTGTVTIGGIDYDYTIRPVGVTSTNGWSLSSIFGYASSLSASGFADDLPLQARSFTSWSTNSSHFASPSTAGSYTPGSRARALNLTWGLTSGNYAGGVESVFVSPRTNTNGLTTFQCAFATPIPKDATKTLSLSFMLSWDRL